MCHDVLRLRREPLLDKTGTGGLTALGHDDKTGSESLCLLHGTPCSFQGGSDAAITSTVIGYQQKTRWHRLAAAGQLKHRRHSRPMLRVSSHTGSSELMTRADGSRYLGELAGTTMHCTNQLSVGDRECWAIGPSTVSMACVDLPGSSLPRSGRMI